MDSVKLSAFSDELEKIAFLGGLGKGLSAAGKYIGRGLAGVATKGTGASFTANKAKGMTFKNAGAMSAQPGAGGWLRSGAALAGRTAYKHPKSVAGGAIGAGTVGAGAIGYNLAGQGRRQ